MPIPQASPLENLILTGVAFLDPIVGAVRIGLSLYPLSGRQRS